MKILVFAVVWRRRHQQEMPRNFAEQSPQPETFRVIRLVAGNRRRHFVRFVTNN